ncbi:MAG: TonB-dependent receptor [Nibricoccus sp.]
MSPTKALPYLFLALGAFCPAALFAQTTTQTKPAAPAGDDVILLSPFTVSDFATGRYQAADAVSGTRMRIPLMDSSQSISVITGDLIADIGAGRVVDAAKYVSGITESTIPNAQDRTTIRGFQNDGATVDGFSYFSFANLDPVLIERVEVVKGPNAIIAPQGVPGGTVNNITKKPVFKDQGSISYQVGRYSANRAELDVNRVAIAGKLAVRVVAAAQNADDYGDYNFHKSYIAMPMFTYRFGPRTELTMQIEAYKWTALNFNGLPLALEVGTNDAPRVVPSVPLDYIVQSKDITRDQSAIHARTFFTTSFSDNFSMRLVLNAINSHAESKQTNIGSVGSNTTTGTQQVTILDPSTGLFVWNGVARPNPTFTLGGNVNDQHRQYFDLNNDYLYELKNTPVKWTVIGGLAINYAATLNEKVQNYTFATTPTTLPLAVREPYTLTNYTGENTRHYRNLQFYLSQQFGFFDDRLIVSGGISRNYYYSENLNLLPPATPTSMPYGARLNVKPKVWLPSAGAVVKLNKNVSLYYGFAKQATAINPNLVYTSSTGVVSNSNSFNLQSSVQHEVGVRTQQFNNTLYATLSVFDIHQNNFSIPNPLNSAVPSPVPPAPPLFFDRVARGAELEVRYAVTKEFSIVGSGTSMTNRDANNMPFRGTAEKAGALWINYSFAKGSTLQGLSAGLGLDYLSKRAGDNTGGATSASTPDHIIRQQPSFWLPARTLVNANVSYQYNQNWKAQLNIDNLLNKEYIQSSTGRTNLWVGAPINLRLKVTYSF